MTAPIVFVDVETTGLHPDRHRIWEVAAIRVDTAQRVERTWQLTLPPNHARDPKADEINRFTERRAPIEDQTGLLDFARQFATFTNRAHLAGAVVSFDEERLRRLLERVGVPHGWHYHLIDVENLAVGYLAGVGSGWRSPERRQRMEDVQPPWNSDELSQALGVTAPDEDRHTALGDARWAEAIYQAVMG